MVFAQLLAFTLGCFLIFQAVVLAVNRMSDRTMNNDNLTVGNTIAEIIRLIEGQSACLVRDIALDNAKKLRDEIDETPPSVRLLQEIRQYADTANLDEIGRKVDDAILRLNRAEEIKAGRTLGLVPLLALVGCFWLFIGPFPMYIVYCFGFAHDSSARGTTTAETSADGENSSPSAKEFFQTTGTFGDTYGAINSLLTAAALAGAIYSILLQTKELKLQREEMIISRRELSRSAEAQSRSEKSLEAQATINGLHYLAEYYRQQAGTSRFELAQHRAKGKERAHITKLENELETLGKSTNESRFRMLASIAIRDFASEVVRLHEEYLTSRDEVLDDPVHTFSPVEDVLCDVAEEIEMIFLLSVPYSAILHLTTASALISQVVYNTDIEPTASIDEAVAARLSRCNRCFELLNRAVEVMGDPSAYPIDDTIKAFLLEGDDGLLRPRPQ